MDRRGVRSGSFFRAVEPIQAIDFPLVEGLLGTSSVYSSVATVGTTPLAVLTKTLDPQIDLFPLKVEVSLTQRFDNLAADSVATMGYYWQARSNNNGTQQAWVPLTATFSKALATSGVSTDPVEDTVQGYFPVASLPRGAPIDVRLMAYGISAAAFTGEVKDTSYVKLVGSVIPGN